MRRGEGGEGEVEEEVQGSGGGGGGGGGGLFFLISFRHDEQTVSLHHVCICWTIRKRFFQNN